MIDDFLRRHDGVITLEQAQRAGMDRRAVHRRVQSGHWRRCARGVYFVADRPFTDSARVRASVWGYGPHAAASGLSAAWWHRLVDRAPEIVEVTVPRVSTGRRHPGTRTRRRDLGPHDTVERQGLRVTSLALTAVETPAFVMDRALQRHADLPELWQAHLRNKGRYGSPRARMLLHGAGDGARSHAERLLITLLRSAGITGWVANLAVGGYLVDVGFPDLKVALEVDGWAFHSDVADFQNDRTRQNTLSLLGWQVLRFTWWHLTERPDRVIAEIRRVISVH
ncbi:type IV toxin-antitoxin system AbiEi family antitoxin domain-containing protein [Mycolicibacterium palauense]|uniref:type IV toxin-antitoxin system AbiEi family antitoxin domain-containing protein n=1 Tax=Mycolicibacterium palauense TaxID=2034511 RepID=UPI000BFF1189|nr:type IV toxin-antitoxin system AbiEi family antitoxin domain-containing protein [Mycolicibacterium palauense]